MRATTVTCLIACSNGAQTSDPAPAAQSRIVAIDARLAPDANVRAERQRQLEEIHKNAPALKLVVGERDDEAVLSSEPPTFCLLMLGGPLYEEIADALLSAGIHRARCSPQMFANIDLDEHAARDARVKWLFDGQRQAELANRGGVRAPKDVPAPFMLGADDELFVIADCDVTKLIRIVSDHAVAQALREHGITSVRCLDGTSVRVQ